MRRGERKKTPRRDNKGRTSEEETESLSYYVTDSVKGAKMTMKKKERA